MSPGLVDVVVGGGGAAGLMAAIVAARRGLQVSLLEKNARLGLKILISGGGRCNLTTTKTGRDLEHEYGARRGRWLRHALRSFPPAALRELIEGAGVPLQEEDLEKVFPVSGKARDGRRGVGVVGARRRRRDRCGAADRCARARWRRVVRAQRGGSVARAFGRAGDGRAQLPAHRHDGGRLPFADRARPHRRADRAAPGAAGRRRGVDARTRRHHADRSCVVGVEGRPASVRSAAPDPVHPQGLVGAGADGLGGLRRGGRRRLRAALRFRARRRLRHPRSRVARGRGNWTAGARSIRRCRASCRLGCATRWSSRAVRGARSPSCAATRAGGSCRR